MTASSTSHVIATLTLLNQVIALGTRLDWIISAVHLAHPLLEQKIVLLFRRLEQGKLGPALALALRVLALSHHALLTKARSTKACPKLRRRASADNGRVAVGAVSSLIASNQRSHHSVKTPVPKQAHQIGSVTIEQQTQNLLRCQSRGAAEALAYIRVDASSPQMVRHARLATRVATRR